MMKSPLRILFAAAVFAFALPSLFAQNTLIDNPNHKKSLELQRMAEKAFADGEYQKSVEYAQEAERLSKTARVEAETERMRFVAYNRMRQADRRIAFCEKEDAPARYPDLWPQALAARAVAGERFEAKDYEPSVEASKRVIEILAPVMPKPRPVAAPKPPEPPKLSEAPKPPEAPPLPATYVVRLIPERRDCLWRIAEYPFVYGDPLKWPLLYEANKERMVQPENPDLIHPGLVLTIPSAAGEKREGVWKE